MCRTKCQATSTSDSSPAATALRSARAGLRRERVIAGRHAVCHEQQHAEVRVDPILPAIQQIPIEPFHIVDPFQIDAVGTDVTEFDHPVIAEPALRVEEPALGVLSFDRWIHDEARRCGSPARRAGSARLPACSGCARTRVVRHRDVVQDRRADPVDGWITP